MNRYFYSRSLLLGALLSTACAEQTFTALSSPPPIQVTGQSSLTVTPGVPFSMTLHATGGAGTYTWRITEGALPPGLGMTANGGPDAVIAGTPAEPTNQASYAATIEVEDAYDNVGTFALGLFVSFTTHGGPLQITTATVARARVGQAYVQTLEAEGGAFGTYEWLITSGQLPAGLSLTSGSTVALVLGVPTQTGTVSARVRVMDADAKSAERDFLFVVDGSPLVISTSALMEACPTSTTSYHAQLEAHGGTNTGYVWSLGGGQFPPGLALSSGGVISGHVTTQGYYTFGVRVEDSVGAIASRVLGIDATCEVYIVDSILPVGTTTTLYQHTLEARGGVAPYTWAKIGGAPNGLELQTSGELIGVPTRTGTITFTVRASDLFTETATKTLRLTVYGPVEITTSSVAVPVWQPVDVQLDARGGRRPYEWTGWNLPLGYVVRSDGHLVGTSTNAGYYVGSVLVRDSLMQTATATITFDVH